MRIALLIIIGFFMGSTVDAQLYFPPLFGSEWETITPESLNWCTDSIEPMYQFLEEEDTKAFLVLKDGKIVLEKYFGEFTQDSIWYWASAGKSLTAFLVGLAQEQEFLSIDDPTNQYLGHGWTSCDTLTENKITIRHQLTMTSAMDDSGANFDCLEPSCLNCIAEPGERWAYHNSPYTLLDSVLYYATGSNANSFFLQNLLPKTGMTGGFFKVGNNNLFLSKARSMARFGLLTLNEGNWNGNQIMEDMDYFDAMVNSSQDLNLAYGYLWWLNGKSSYRLPGLQSQFSGPIMPNAPDDMVSALGKNGQILNVVPNDNLILVRMGNASQQFLIGSMLNDKIWEYMNAIRCQPNAIESVETNSGVLVYPNPTNNSLTITLNHNTTPEQLQLIDNQGRRIGLDINRNQIFVSNLTPGVYFL